MQSQRLQTFPSKAIGLYASIEWGLSGVKTLSPFSFAGRKGDKELTFHTKMLYSKDYMVDIPKFEEQFLVLCILNKQGDNCVVLTKQACEDVMGSQVDFHWVAKHLKRKFHVQYTPTSDLLPDS